MTPAAAQPRSSRTFDTVPALSVVASPLPLAAIDKCRSRQKSGLHGRLRLVPSSSAWLRRRIHTLTAFRFASSGGLIVPCDCDTFSASSGSRGYGASRRLVVLTSYEGTEDASLSWSWSPATGAGCVRPRSAWGRSQYKKRWTARTPGAGACLSLKFRVVACGRDGFGARV